MTTKHILSEAYADVLGIDVHENGLYYDKKFSGNLTIAYASFDAFHEVAFHDDDFFETAVKGGREGLWIVVDHVHYRDDTQSFERNDAGFVSACKSEIGLAAWRDMGTLAWLLAYTANKIAYISQHHDARPWA